MEPLFAALLSVVWPILALIAAAYLLEGSLRAVSRLYLPRLQQARLRRSPPAQRLVELSLSRGVTDSQRRWARVLAQLAPLIRPGATERREGKGSVSLIWLGETRAPQRNVEAESSASVRFLVASDPETSEEIETRAKTEFGDELVVAQVENELQEVADWLCSPPPEPEAT